MVDVSGDKVAIVTEEWKWGNKTLWKPFIYNNGSEHPANSIINIMELREENLVKTLYLQQW